MAFLRSVIRPIHAYKSVSKLSPALQMAAGRQKRASRRPQEQEKRLCKRFTDEQATEVQEIELSTVGKKMSANPSRNRPPGEAERLAQ